MIISFLSLQACTSTSWKSFWIVTGTKIFDNTIKIVFFSFCHHQVNTVSMHPIVTSSLGTIDPYRVVFVVSRTTIFNETLSAYIAIVCFS